MRVVLSKTAQKQYQKLSPIEGKKIKKKLNSLESDQLTGKKLAGELKLFRSLRAWPYRIIYYINEGEDRVEVVDIEHRQGVYK